MSVARRKRAVLGSGVSQASVAAQAKLVAVCPEGKLS